MAGRKTRGATNAGKGSGETDVPDAVKSSQISSIAIVGDAVALPDGAGVTDYLVAYLGRRVSFYNPLTGEADEREAAEVIALQMVIGALHGDKSAINRLIERTEGKVGVGAAAARKRVEGAPLDPNDPRAIAAAVEAERQNANRAREDEREASVGAITRIMTQPAAPAPAVDAIGKINLTLARTGEETIM